MQQQQLIGLLTTGSQNTTSQSYLNFSYTALASVTTDQMQLLKLLTANNIKVSPTEYQNAVPAGPATELKQAQQVSTFESTYGPVILAQLNLYHSYLSSAFNLNKSTVLRSYLSADYKRDNTLIKLLDSSTP